MWLARSCLRPSRVIGVIGDVSLAGRAAGAKHTKFSHPHHRGIRWQSESNLTEQQQQFKPTLRKKHLKYQDGKPVKPASQASLQQQQADVLAQSADRIQKVSKDQATWWEADRSTDLHLRNVAHEVAQRDEKTSRALARKYAELVDHEDTLVTPEQQEKARISAEAEAKRQIISGEALILRRGADYNMVADDPEKMGVTVEPAHAALMSWLKRDRPEGLAMAPGPDKEQVTVAIKTADEMVARCQDYLNDVEALGKLDLSEVRRQDAAKQVLDILAQYDKIVDDLESRVRVVIMNATTTASQTENVGTEDARQLLKRVVDMQQLFEVVSDRNALLESFPIGNSFKDQLGYLGLRLSALTPKGGKKDVGPKRFIFWSIIFIITSILIIIYV